MNPRQFRLFIVRPVLNYLELHSPAAENLLMGTVAVESQFKHVDQITSKDDVFLGPAFGLYQMERITHDDLWETYLNRKPQLAHKVAQLLAWWPRDRCTQLVTNVAYATAMARIRYYRVPDPLPADDDLEGLAAYWKQHYNTPAGAGTVAKFILHYRDLKLGG